MKFIIQVSKRGTITLPPQCRKRLKIDSLANPLMIVEEINGKIVMELATALPVRDIPAETLRSWITEDEDDLVKHSQSNFQTNANPQTIKPMPLPALIQKTHIYSYEPENLPMPQGGNGPTIHPQNNGSSRVYCGVHAFVGINANADFVYWVNLNSVRVGVFFHVNDQNALDILQQRAAALDNCQIRRNVMHPTIVFIVDGGINNPDEEHPKIAQSCVKRMLELWRVLQGIQ